ncbi:MAG TPA: radical SAM protein [Bacteriovoracaceae bacterium]|nr:radical SAM protein [Bacteriovoracaceae bacterium]
MKKAVIIRTPFIHPLKHLSSISAVPDIGTAYINGTLRKLGYDSRIIDATGEGIGRRIHLTGTELAIGGIPAREIIEKIEDDIDIFGLQAMHSNRWIYDSYILKKLYERFPQAKVFLGGEHASACYDKILTQFPQITAVIIGEGEETLVELLATLEKGEPLDQVAGLAFVRNNQVVVTPRRRRRSDLANLPRPSWEGVPIKKYLDNNCGVNSLSRRAITMVATRGCPHTCTFCTVPNMWESKWFARPPEDVIDEMKYNMIHLGVNHIDFVDLTLVINKKWMHEFCDLLIKENLDLTWAIPIGTRTESLDSDLLKKMKASGLSRVLYSAESGDDQTLDRIKKKLNIKHFNKIVRETTKLGIAVKVALIFGFPGQTLKEVWTTFLLVNKLAWLGVNDIVCLSFVPYPKTELFDQLKIDYDYNSLDNNIRLNNDIPNMKSWSEHFSDRALKFFVVSFTLYFYSLQGLLRPHRVIAGAYRVFVKRVPLTNFESLVFNFLTKRKQVLETEDIGLK